MSFIVTSIFVFFFNDTATTEIYTLSLHDALPIPPLRQRSEDIPDLVASYLAWLRPRSEEHTSELQSQSKLVCRLLLEKKKYTAQTRVSSLRQYSIWRGFAGSEMSRNRLPSPY